MMKFTAIDKDIHDVIESTEDPTYKCTIQTWATKMLNISISADKCKAEAKRLAERATKKRSRALQIQKRLSPAPPPPTGRSRSKQDHGRGRGQGRGSGGNHGMAKAGGTLNCGTQEEAGMNQDLAHHHKAPQGNSTGSKKKET